MDGRLTSNSTNKVAFWNFYGVVWGITYTKVTKLQYLHNKKKTLGARFFRNHYNIYRAITKFFFLFSVSA